MTLVTGATGNIGRQLVPKLLHAGHRVRVLVRDKQKVAHLGNQVEVAVGDLDNPESILTAMQGVERLFFVTAVTRQVASLLEAAKRAGVRHVLKISTIEADRSLGPGRWHREQERMIEESSIPWTFLRPTLMMVNTIQWWGRTIQSQGRVYFPGGTGQVPPVDPHDVAAVACAALSQPQEHQGRTYELTGPELLTVAEMVQTLSKVLERPIRYVPVPLFAATFAMRRMSLSKTLAKALAETLRAWRRNEYAYVTDAVEKVTGRPPRSFEMWCREHCACFEGS